MNKKKYFNFYGKLGFLRGKRNYLHSTDIFEQIFYINEILIYLILIFILKNQFIIFQKLLFKVNILKFYDLNVLLILSTKEIIRIATGLLFVQKLKLKIKKHTQKK